MENSIKIWRARRDLTQEELANEIGVARQTINAIEVGRYNPSIELAFDLAAYFDCQIEDIFHPDGESD